MTNFKEGSTRLSFPSGADFTSSGTVLYPPFTFVKLNSSKKVVAITAVTDPAIGILYNLPDANGTADVLSVNQQGTFKATAGGTIAVNDLLTFDNTGKVVTAVQTTAGSQPTVLIVGRALEAGVSGRVIEAQSLNFLY